MKRREFSWNFRIQLVRREKPLRRAMRTITIMLEPFCNMI